MKIIAKFRASRRLLFEDTERIMSPEMHPKGFGTFEKRAPGEWAIRSWAENQYTQSTGAYKDAVRPLSPNM